MRLTLRTMLCYMDEILEPADHADIGQKIEQSEFARDLMVKTRDVTKRLRLAAPAVLGKGMGADANSVAEYLDNTMPAERVAEFEKICLESDVHLAEVAASHQILTLVLGEPAEVDPASRERMYHIPALAARLEQEAKQAVPPPKSAEVLAAGATGAAATATKVKKERGTRQKPEVPDYLRESARSRWKLKAAMAVLAAGIGFIVLAFINPGRVFDPLFGVSQETPAHVDAPDSVAPPEIETNGLLPPGPSGTPDVASTAPSGGAAPAFDPNAGGGAAPPFDPSAGGTAPPFDPSAGGPAPKFEPNVAPALPETDVAIAPPAATAPAPAEGDSAAPAEPPVPAAVPEVKLPAAETAPAPVPAKAPAIDPAAPAAKSPPEPAPAPGLPAPADESSDMPPDEAPVEVAALPTNKIPAPPSDQAPEHVGVFVSPSSVLLRLDGEMGQWSRLGPRSALASGDRLLALPTYRPTINLTSGATMHLAGGTSVVLGAPVDGAPMIQIIYGRVIISGSVAQGGNHVRLQWGDKVYSVTLANAESTVAVHVRRVHVPGADPEAAPAPTVVDVYAAAGKVIWQEVGAEGAQPVEIQAPRHHREGALVVGEPEIDPTKIPEWIDAEQLTGSDRLASLSIEAALTLDRPAGLSLSELVDRRRSEVRSLAARCAVYVGQYEPFVQSLKDQDQRASWSLHIETLREAMALSPENAARIRTAFERSAGQEGAALYRMLWGYSQADLEGGADQQLVDYLKSPNLDFRVLAFWNLKNITGLGLNYGPEYPEPSRLRSIQRWEQLLAEQKIRLPELGTASGAADPAAPLPKVVREPISP